MLLQRISEKLPMRRRALILLEKQIHNELRSGYDEKIGVAALLSVRSILIGRRLALSRRTYVEYVVKELLRRMEQQYRLVDGGFAYSNGASSIGSYTEEFVAMSHTFGIVVDLDIRLLKAVIR